MRKFQSLTQLLMTLAYAIGVFSWAIAPTAYALAETPQQENRDPSARVQIILNGVRILDDNDPGSGEFEAWMSLLCFSAPSPCLGQTSAGISSFAYKRFSGATGETITLDEVHPTVGDAIHELAESSVQIGYPLYAGHRYELRFNLIEKDPLTDPDKLGLVTFVMEQGQNWGMGEHTLRSVQANGSPGDFELLFQVRPTPLADLNPTSMTVTRPTGSAEHRICVNMLNRGARGSIGYPVLLYLDESPEFIAVELGDGLGSGQNDTVCLHATLPTTGVHTLTAVVDGARTVPEENENNNRVKQQYDPKGVNSNRPNGTQVGTYQETQQEPLQVPAQATPRPTPPTRPVSAKPSPAPR